MNPSKITGLHYESTLLTQAVILNALVGPSRSVCPERLGPASMPSGLILGGHGVRTKRLLDICTLPADEVTREQSLEAGDVDLKALERLMDESTCYGQGGQTRSAVQGFATSSGGFISNHVYPVDARRELIRPIVLIRNPVPETFEKLLNESMQGSPLIVDDGNLIQRALSGQLDSKWKKLLAQITHGIGGYNGLFEFPFKVNRAGQAEFRRFGFVGLCDDAQALLQSDRPEAQALARACLVQEVRMNAGQKSQGSNWYPNHSGAVRRIIEARRHGQSLAVGIDAPQADQILALESEILDFAPQASLLPRMLVYALMLHNPGEGLLKHALSWAKRIASSLATAPSVAELELQNKKAKLLGHIQAHEPCNWSTVARHYSIQKKECHQEALNALISEGSITLDDQGRFKIKSVA